MMNGSIKVRYLLVAVLGLTLASCGTVYRTPEVVEGVAGGTNVRVMNLTAESVIQANRSAYAPRSLPDVFPAPQALARGCVEPGRCHRPHSTFRPAPMRLSCACRPRLIPVPTRLVSVMWCCWPHRVPPDRLNS